MPPNEGRQASRALTDTQDTDLGFAAAAASTDTLSGVIVLADGLDAFVARAVLAQSAQRSLDVQYYLFHRDTVGLLLLQQLLAAADRGVRVRLLVDDMDMGGTDNGVAALTAHPNIQVRLFNPFSRERTRLGQLGLRFGSVTRRMHNKSFTADNQMTIIGGRNIGNEYFAADPSVAFADMDVLMAGPAAQAVSIAFDQYWNHALSYTINNLGHDIPTPEALVVARRQLQTVAASSAASGYLKALQATPLLQQIKQQSLQFHPAPVAVYYDSPDKINHDRDQQQLHMAQYLAPYFANARREVLIISPYFVPGKIGSDQMCELARNGVSVQVLTNSLASTDVSVVHAGYIRYRKKLLRCGVQLFEASSQAVMAVAAELAAEQQRNRRSLGLSRTSLHAKVFVFDRHYTFIGSLNLDPRSVVENTEIGAVIESEAVANQVADNIIKLVPQMAFKLNLDENGDLIWHGYENGEAVSYNKDPHSTCWQRFSTSLLRYLPIESQI